MNYYKELEIDLDINSILDFSDGLSNLNLPIYYLFDEHINQNIGSNSYLRDIALSKFNINTILGIIPENIINVSSNNHATLFYVFDNYFYYSNTGLGIPNHLMEDHYFVFPKLFKACA